jgi:hypothetical protein
MGNHSETKLFFDSLIHSAELISIDFLDLQHIHISPLRLSGKVFTVFAHVGDLPGPWGQRPAVSSQHAQQGSVQR